MKKSRFRFLSTLLIFTPFVFLLLLLTGCSVHVNKENNYKNVVDVYGRSVDVPAEVNKIATAGSATRLCVYAGCSEKLVAITQMDKPDISRPYTIAYKDKFESLPTTSNGNHLNFTDIDIESIIKLSPDVIFSTRSKDECQNLQDKINIPVVGVNLDEDIFSSTLTNSLNIIGQVAGCEDKVNQVNSFMQNCRNEFKEYSTQDKHDLRIYRGAINYKGSKGLTGTYSKLPIYSILNIKTVEDRDDITGAYDTTIEQILTWNPEIILFDFKNLEKVKNDYNNNKEILAKIDAFKNNQIFTTLPFNNNATNVEYALCEAFFISNKTSLNPKNDLEMESKYSEVIKTLLGVDCYQELKSLGAEFKLATF